ncbi:ABC transporter ATP-binding protein [Acidobacteriota bacterium]
MIQVEDLTKSFDSVRAVDNATFGIPSGSITVLAGADGAGKSTLFKMILGLVRKDGGEIFLKGKSVGKDFSQITRITGYMPERFSLYPDLSVEENLNFFADIYGTPLKRREELKTRLLDRTGMSDFINRRARDLSGGMRQKLALSTILLSSPEFIILDEPTTGVDPISRIEFFEIIDELKNEGKTIFIATPYLDEAEKGDRIIFIKKGGILLEDSIAELKKNFPARLMQILPEENIFQTMDNLEKNPKIRANVYMRGRYLRFMETDNVNFPDNISIKEKSEIPPTLEDIYIFYERAAADDRR